MAIPKCLAIQCRCGTVKRPEDTHPPLRIVILNDVFDARDATPDAVLDRYTTLTGWANAIHAQGADVLVCQRFHDNARLTLSDVSYQFFADRAGPRPSLSFGGNRQAQHAARSFNPNVAHVNGMDYPRAIRRLRAALPATTALIVQDHGGFEPCRLSWFRKAWIRRGLNAADALLAATLAQARDFRASGLVPESTAIRDVMEASTNLRSQRPRVRDGRLNVLWVGRLNANKDPLTVLTGFAAFATARRNATLKFVYGTTELEAALREAIRRHPFLHDRVQLTGAVSHELLADIYGEADLFVLGSHREGSGYAVLEAMACGVVPVLTNIPSFRGLTDGGRVGELWDIGNPESLAAALLRVTDGETLESKSEACRSRFESCFSWNAIGTRAMEIYRECSAR
jgi:glycosyltransferase involved in cell wall biosynthesis